MVNLWPNRVPGRGAELNEVRMGTQTMPARRQITVTIPIGGSYIAELGKRLDEYGISHNALARQMEVPPSQVSRWFNRPNMSPNMQNIAKIEQAIHEILRDREKHKKRR
jgi:predicted transcriptional regulator